MLHRAIALNIVILACWSNTAFSHSWLHCADYDDATKTCRGWPRNFHKVPTIPLGQDMGRDVRPGAQAPAGLVCDPNKEGDQDALAGRYSAQYPMTKLAAGQLFMQTWPAKNHAQVGEDRGVQIYISKTPNGGDDFSHVASKEAWIQQHPKLTYTFSECDPPGPAIDRAECKGKYEVPTDLAPGVYTFMWFWEFNAGEYYNSCFDVEITPSQANPANPAPTPTPVGSPNPATPGNPSPNPSPGVVPSPSPVGTGSTVGQATGSTAGQAGQTPATGSTGYAGAATGGYTSRGGGGGVGMVGGASSMHSLTFVFLTLSLLAIYSQL